MSGAAEISRRIHPARRCLAAVPVPAFCLGAVLLWPVAGQAQPVSALRTTCDGLRAALKTLPKGDEPVYIAVEGVLTRVHADSALAYLTLCGPPHPRVICVTYATNDSQPGDKVAVSGEFSPRGPEMIVLDPCLHASKDAPKDAPAP